MKRKRDETKKIRGDVQQKITLLCVVFLLCVAVLPSTVSAAETADYSWYDVQKTELTISDVNDLIGFANIVNGKATGISKDTFAGKTVRLTNDIDLTGRTWTPIGSSNYDKKPGVDDVKMFAGNFDGGNHVITGLSSEGYVPDSSETGSTEYSFGLFGYVYGSNFSNVKLADVDIDCGTRKDSAGQDVDGSGVAALIGYYHVANVEECVIENCHVLSGTVKASNNMGGLIGHMDSQISQPIADITIIDCSNAADVTTEAREAGGILGLMNSAREDGNIYVTMRGTITFKDCINTGDITSLGRGSPSAGGILGRDHNQAAGQRLKLIFDGCENSGTITVTANGETHAAGIASGYYSAGAWLIAKDCSNTGDVVVNNPSNEVYAGGLISYGGVVELIDSISTSTVTGGTASNRYVGGAQNILFLEKMDDFSDTVNGNTYYLNGGTSPEYAALVDDAAGGGNFHLVETAYKDGYKFDGWYDNPEFTGEAYTALGNNVKNYYAKWAPVIILDANGGVGDRVVLELSTTQLPPNTFTRDNYRFAEWNTKADGTGDSYSDGDKILVESSTILYAQWESVVTFNANDGSGEMPEMAIGYGKSENLKPNTFTRTNYEFAGWAESEDGGVAYTDKDFITPTGNITLYAKWKGAITFNANGGTGEMNPQEILQGSAVTLAPNTFTLTGYLFNNWNTNPDNTGISYADKETVPFAENMVLYANWTECNYHNFIKEVVAPEYLKSPATHTQKAVYYKSCTECGKSSEGTDGEATFEYGDVLEKLPENNTGGGTSTEGTYITMIRDAPEEGGEVLFKNSATPVESVTVPAGIIDGKIVVSAITDADAPQGKETEALFDVSISGSYPAGKETIITVSLSKSKLTQRGLTEADACLYHFNGEEWTKLFTTYEVSGNTVIYHGTTKSCSPFALVYEIGGAVLLEVEEPVDEPTEQPPADIPSEILPPSVDVPTEIPETPTPILGILAGLGYMALFIRRK